MKWVQQLPLYQWHKRSNSLWTVEQGEECQEVEGPVGDFQQMLCVSDGISIRREEDQPQFDMKGIKSEMRL